MTTNIRIVPVDPIYVVDPNYYAPQSNRDIRIVVHCLPMEVYMICSISSGNIDTNEWLWVAGLRIVLFANN